MNVMHKQTDQPEVALRYYRRLLQMGANSPEVWQNLGLCCFYAAQYDMSLKCLERALAMASDDTSADIWLSFAFFPTRFFHGWFGKTKGLHGILENFGLFCSYDKLWVL